MDNNYNNIPPENNGNNLNNDDKDKKKNQKILLIIIAALATIMLVTSFTSLIQNTTSAEITYSEFLAMLDVKEIKSVEITADGVIKITPKSSDSLSKAKKSMNKNNTDTAGKEDADSVSDNNSTSSGINSSQEEATSQSIYSALYGNTKKIYWTMILSSEKLYDELKEADVDFKVDRADTSSSIVEIVLSWVLPFLFLYLIFGIFIRKMSKGGGGIMGGVGKTNAKMYDMEKKTGVTFKDVAGQDEAKESMTEIVDFLHNPGKYAEIGAKLPKGALLVGPPGTGKTLLAKAVAGEAKVPFFSLSGSDFVEMFVGVGASRVRDLFKEAQKNAPCIVFIDEIDAIGKSRDSRYGGGNDEREQTLNQLLSEMDGFDSSKGIFMLAATNRPDVLDKALLRPGRFDRRIIVDKPDLKGRVETLRVHSKNVLMDDTVDLEAIGLATSGAVGSDLANMVNEAAINAVKSGRKAISQADLFEAVEVVIAGKEKKDRILSPVEKRTVACHEVGHALVTALEKNTEPVQKITIVPRTMGSLGYVMQVPEEEKYLMTKDEMISRITTLLGGRAAEAICFETVTTGASNDMEKATEMARAMITRYGMSEKFGLMSLEEVQDSYLSGRTVMNCSDATATEIDTEVKELLKKCYDRALELLKDNKEILDKIADFLYEKETITGKEFMEIYHKVKGDIVDDTEETAETDAEQNTEDNLI